MNIKQKTLLLDINEENISTKMWKTNLFVLSIFTFILTIDVSHCEIYSTLVDPPGGIDPILGKILTKF